MNEEQLNHAAEIVVNTDSLFLLMARDVDGSYKYQPVAMRQDDDGKQSVAIGKICQVKNMDKLNAEFAMIGAIANPGELTALKVDGSDECGCIISRKDLDGSMLYTTVPLSATEEYFTLLFSNEAFEGDDTPCPNIFTETVGFRHERWADEDDAKEYPHLSFDQEILAGASDSHEFVDGTIDEAVATAKMHGAPSDDEIVN